MIVVRQGIVTVVECWFGEQPSSGADVASHRQSPTPIPGVKCTTFNTLLIDLTKDSEDLLAAMKKDTRNCIRRADSKDNLTYEWDDNPSPEKLEEFSQFYDDFARSKDIPLVGGRNLPGYLKAGRLALSRILTESGDTIVWHAVQASEKRIRDIVRASTHREAPDGETRQMMGRANRYLTWRDLLKGQEIGKTEYDVGGWYPGTEDQSLLRVNAFKEEFGGARVEEYDGVEALTPKGKLYLGVRHLRGKS